MALATLAAIIASQAVISGAFSMTKQAIQLGFLPSMTVRYIAAREAGQIYMPAVNWALLAGVMAAVAFFRNAAALAGIYGIAVTLTMFTTTLLTFFVVRDGWRLPAPVAVGATLFFLVLDGRLVAGGAVKFFDGGWFAPATGLLLFGMKSTWLLGRALLRESLRRDGIELQPFIDSLGNEGLRRVARSAVFLMAEPGTVPNALLHNFKHNPVVHGRNALVTVVFHEVPWIGADRRAVVQSLGHGIGALSFTSASWTSPTCRRPFGHSWRWYSFGDPHDERSAQRRASAGDHALRHREAARHRQPHHPGKPGQSHSLATGERVNSSMALPIGLKDGAPRFALGLPGGLHIFR